MKKAGNVVFGYEFTDVGDPSPPGSPASEVLQANALARFKSTALPPAPTPDRARAGAGGSRGRPRARLHGRGRRREDPRAAAADPARRQGLPVARAAAGARLHGHATGAGPRRGRRRPDGGARHPGVALGRGAAQLAGRGREGLPAVLVPGRGAGRRARRGVSRQGRARGRDRLGPGRPRLPLRGRGAGGPDPRDLPGQRLPLRLRAGARLGVAPRMGAVLRRLRAGACGCCRACRRSCCSSASPCSPCCCWALRPSCSSRRASGSRSSTPASRSSRRSRLVAALKLTASERETRDVAAEKAENQKLLGLSFQEKGMLDMALATFNKLPVSDDMKQVYLNLGLDYENRSQRDKAYLVYKKIFDVDPRYEDVAHRMERLSQAGAGASIFGAPTGNLASVATAGQFGTPPPTPQPTPPVQASRSLAASLPPRTPAPAPAMDDLETALAPGAPAAGGTVRDPAMDTSLPTRVAPGAAPTQHVPATVVGPPATIDSPAGRSDRAGLALRPLPDRAPPRPRRDGRRLPGARHHHQPPGRAQDDPPRLGPRRQADYRDAPALLPRGADRGQAQPPPHRHRLRRGGGPRHVLHRDGVHRGPDAHGLDEEGAPERPADQARHLQRGPRSRLRPRQRRLPPRRQARQHHAVQDPAR